MQPQNIAPHSVVSPQSGQNGRMLLFSGCAHPELAKQIAASLKMELGKMVLKDFSDGELFVKFDQNIRGQEVFLIQPTLAPARNLLELLMMIDAARRASAKRITAVLPYFGYARQDRKDQPRVSITAKLVANLLTVAGANRILSMDLHAQQVQGFFDIPFDHLYASSVFIPYLEQLQIPNLVIVAPDLGGTAAARAYAKHFNCPIATIDKRRPRPNAVEAMNVIGNVDGMNALMVDDVCDTAGTLTSGAAKLKEYGAQKIYAACSHAILSGEAVARLEASPIDLIMLTDSVPVPAVKVIDKMKFLSVDWLFGDAIQRIHSEGSITELIIT